MRATLRWAHADLRTHRGEALFLVLATAGIVASLLLAAALFGYATNPWQRVFTQSHGAHVWIHTGPSADTGALAGLDGVESVAGPYRTVRSHRRLPRRPGRRRTARHRRERPATRPPAAHLRPLARPRRPPTASSWRAASPVRCWPGRATPSPCPAPPRT